MRRTVAILGLVSGIAAAPAAWAGGDMFTSTPPERPQTSPDPNDFGWQVLGADLAGLAATIALGTQTRNMAGLLPYLLAAPTVHLAHKDVPGAAGSLLLNVAFPVGLGYLRYQLHSWGCGPDAEGCGGLGLLAGGLIGFGLAWGLDSTYLSHPGRPPSGPAIRVTPAVDPNRIFSLVLSGRF